MSNRFNELRAQRLSIEGRGMLYTLLSVEGKLLNESLLPLLCGENWERLSQEILRCGIGRLELVDNKQRIWRFVHFAPPEERRRVYLREHKRKTRRKQHGQEAETV